MVSSPPQFRALVFGASGITGWAIMKEALRYPKPETFDCVIGLTNRPLTKENSYLPKDDRIRLFDGIDLTAGLQRVKERLQCIEGIEGVTHVYFAAYTGHESAYSGQENGRKILRDINVEILETAVRAVEGLCHKLQFWTLQTGGKSYGFDVADKIGLPKAPCQESEDRIPEPYASENMYYGQYDVLSRQSKGKAWTFAEVRPDGVIGFVPHHNAMNLAQTLALFLSFYASKNGAGAFVPYPGPLTVYNALYTDIGQNALARFHIYVSMHEQLSSGKAFNIGEQDAGTSWAEKWDALCAFFGLRGKSPEAGALTGVEYMMVHRDEWKEWTKRVGIRDDVLETAGWDFMAVMLSLPGFDRQYDLSRSREIGWTETGNSLHEYLKAFSMMREARIIP